MTAAILACARLRLLWELVQRKRHDAGRDAGSAAHHQRLAGVHASIPEGGTQLLLVVVPVAGQLQLISQDGAASPCPENLAAVVTSTAVSARLASCPCTPCHLISTLQ